VTAKSDKLEKRVDTALSSWPMPEREAAAWESMAENIEARITAVGASRASTGTLLDAPFPPDARDKSTDRDGDEASTGLNNDRGSGIGTPQGSQERSSSPQHQQQGSGPSGSPPSAQGEGRMSQPTMERDRERRSLKDLAKLANSPSLTPTPPPSAATKGAPAPASSRAPVGDSGIVDLKMMAQLDPQAAERAKDTKLASSELFDEEPPSERPASSAPALSAPASSAKMVATSSAPAAAASAGRISAAPSSGKLAAVPSVPAAPQGAKAAQATPASEGKKGGMLWLGIAGVVAAAAAAVLMLRSQPSEAPLATAASAKPVAAAPAPAPRPAPAQAAAKETPAVADNTPVPSSAGDPSVDTSKLPQAPAVTAGGGQPAVARSVSPGPQKSVAVAGKPPEKPEKRTIVANNLPSNPQGGSFDNALRQAAGPTDTPSEGPASPSSGPQFDPGSVPQKPAAGAIAGGIGSVMGEARACLGLDDPISYASITFGSAGSVTSVGVSGFAAGKPAEACIKGALSKAKVPPFAQPSYTQKVTVRPNS
jgi:hypothetical protein